MLVARANAKINLGTEILGRRPDGFHEVVTVLQQVNFGDRLTFQESSDLSLTTTEPALMTETNLVWRAASSFRALVDTYRGAAIHLEKVVPLAAGLGGGSADAAVTLLALNNLWQLNQPMESLATVAKSLGSDVPFFLRGGTQLATGRGDVLEPLPTPLFWAVLVITRASVGDKTRRLYEALRPADYTDGGQTMLAATCLRFGRPIDYRKARSGFQRVTLDLFPDLEATFDAVEADGGTPIVCGAGPTVMSLHGGESEAETLAGRLRRRGLEARVVQPVPPDDWRRCDSMSQQIQPSDRPERIDRS